MFKLIPNKNRPKMIRKNDMSISMEDILQMAPRGITVQFGSWAWQLSQRPTDQLLSPDITAHFDSWAWQPSNSDQLISCCHQTSQLTLTVGHGSSHSDQLISCHLTSQLNLAVWHGSSHSDQLISCQLTSQLNVAVGHGSSHSNQLISCHSTPLKTKHFQARKADSHLQNTFTA
jgi:hypothetical protein